MAKKSRFVTGDVVRYVGTRFPVSVGETFRVQMDGRYAVDLVSLLDGKPRYIVAKKELDLVEKKS